MKAKTLIILVVAVCVLSLAAYTLVLNKERGGAGTKLGEKLYNNLPMNEVSEIRIFAPGGSVTLAKGDLKWGVKERNGYPANFMDITSLVKKVAALKKGRSFKAEPEALSRLSLQPMENKEAKDEEKATHLILASAKGDVLADLFIGKERTGSSGNGGQYVKKAKSDEIVLVDKEFNLLNKTPEEWIDKDLFKIEPENIRSVICRNAEGNTVYHLERPEKGKDPQITGSEPGLETDESKLNQAFDALSAFMIQDVADATTQLNASSHRFEYLLFDGTRYILSPSKSGEGDEAVFYLKASVDYVPNLSEEKSEDTGEDKANAPAGGKTAKELAKTENDRIGPWIYTITQWKYETFITDPTAFVKKEEEQADKTQG